MSRDIAWDVPEGGRDGDIALIGDGESDGSDHTSCPAAMVTDPIPENARALSVAVSMVLSTAGCALHVAKWADWMVTEPLPAKLENSTRSRLPPSETWTTWRRTLFDSEAGGGFSAS